MSALNRILPFSEKTFDPGIGLSYMDHFKSQMKRMIETSEMGDTWYCHDCKLDQLVWYDPDIESGKSTFEDRAARVAPIITIKLIRKCAVCNSTRLGISVMVNVKID